MANLPAFDQLKSNTVLTIKSSYQDIDKLIERKTDFLEPWLSPITFRSRSKTPAYKYPIQSKLELEAEFNRLAEEWRTETRMLSLVTHKSMHPTYQRIIGMGKPVIPLILQDIAQKPDHWFWALRAITGENPVKPEQVGRMKLMAQAWIQWAKEHGYEW